MPKVTFKDTRTVNDGTGTTFEAGQTYELPTASCERWIRRGAAAYAEGSGPEKETKVIQNPSLKNITVDVSNGGVTIPDNWADLPWLDFLALAKEFDPEARSKDDATAAIEKEIERRKTA